MKQRQAPPDLEDALFHICDQHYCQTRRVVTCLGLPLGTMGAMQRWWAENRPEATCRPILWTSAGPVALEALDLIEHVVIISDRPWPLASPLV